MGRQINRNQDRNHRPRPKRFGGITSSLRGKDFRWLKDDMDFFALPENRDKEVQDRNNYAGRSAYNLFAGAHATGPGTETVRHQVRMVQRKPLQRILPTAFAATPEIIW